MKPAAALLTLACLGATLGGCAYSMVRDGRFVDGAFESLAERTARVTDSPLPADLRTQIVSIDEIAPILRGVLEEQWAPGEIDDYRDGLVAIGLWPRDRDLVEDMLSVSSDEVAGFYVPTRRTLYVIGDARIPFSMRVASSLSRRDFWREFVLAHELVHAHQHASHPALLDEYFTMHHQDDAVAAVSASIEGDATRYGLASAFEGIALPDPESIHESMEQDVENRSGGALSEVPALLRLTLVFPYSYGYVLSYREGRGLLDSPPASTEQVLHPERGREPFTAIDLSRVEGSLPGTCRVLDRNTLGELVVSVLFRDLDPTPSAAAWEGWDGDRYVAARCGERLEFVWLTSWDSEEEAAQFEAAYAEIASAVGARAGHATPPRAQRSDREVMVVTAGLEHLAAVARTLARRERVSTLPALRAHFDESP
jgi:hypothetical protein